MQGNDNQQSHGLSSGKKKRKGIGSEYSGNTNSTTWTLVSFENISCQYLIKLVSTYQQNHLHFSVHLKYLSILKKKVSEVLCCWAVGICGQSERLLSRGSQCWGGCPPNPPSQPLHPAGEGAVECVGGNVSSISSIVPSPRPGGGERQGVQGSGERGWWAGDVSRPMFVPLLAFGPVQPRQGYSCGNCLLFLEAGG